MDWWGREGDVPQERKGKAHTVRVQQTAKFPSSVNQARQEHESNQPGEEAEAKAEEEGQEDRVRKEHQARGSESTQVDMSDEHRISMRLQEAVLKRDNQSSALVLWLCGMRPTPC